MSYFILIAAESCEDSQPWCADILGAEKEYRLCAVESNRGDCCKSCEAVKALAWHREGKLYFGVALFFVLLKSYRVFVKMSTYGLMHRTVDIVHCLQCLV